MPDESAQQVVPIFTIGYGAREMPAFIETLQAHQIAYLLDVRSRPYSRYKPEFSKPALESHLREAGIRYVFMGDTLGGQPEDRECYGDDGKVDYKKVRQTAFFSHGIERLQDAWSQGLRVVLMCSEGKPEHCHRSMLIGAALQDMEIDVAHIDDVGLLVSQQEVMNRSRSGQMSLFPDEPARLTSRKRYPADE